MEQAPSSNNLGTSSGVAPPPPGEDPLLWDGKVWTGHRLKLAHAFGLYPAGFRDAVVTLGDDAFAFCVGRQIAICDHVRQRVSFIQRDAQRRVVTALAQSPNEKLLAVAERVGIDDRSSQISILNIARSESSSSPSLAALGNNPMKGGQHDPAGNAGTKHEVLRVLIPLNKRVDIDGLAFTEDSRFLVSLSGSPDYTITYWRWEIDKAVASHDIKLPVTRLSISPRNGFQLSVSGPNYLRLWEYNPNDHHLREFPSMFSMKEEKVTNIVDHCWILDACLCAITDEGVVHLFEDGEQRGSPLDVRDIISKEEASGPKAAEREQEKLLQGLIAGAGRQSAGTNSGPRPVKLKSIAPWSRGFVVGGDQGYVGVFKVDPRLNIEPFGTFRMPGEDPVIWQMSASSEDSHLIILSYEDHEIEEDGDARPSANRRSVATSSGKRPTLAVDAPALCAAEGKKQRCWKLSTFPVGQADLAATGQLEVFAPVYPLGLHHGPIASMAAAGVRRVVATCGKDMQLKVWSYPSENDPGGQFASELSFAVSAYERPKALAIHPLGFQVAVILEDVLRVYHLTTQGMTRTLFDLSLKFPGDVAYSTTGHMLAATAGNDVVLLDCWRSTVIHLFSGHGGHLSAVNQVLFSADDQMLLSCSVKGAIYGWQLEGQSPSEKIVLSAEKSKEELSFGDKAFEHVSKGTNYSCIAHDIQSGLVIACTKPGGNLRVIKHQSSCSSVEVASDGKGAGYTSICLVAPRGVVFAGTQLGSIRAFRWPMEEGQNAFAEFAVHASSITSLSLSCDLRYIFSSCETGTVFACEIESVSKGEVVPVAETELARQFVSFRYRQDDSKKKANSEEERKTQEMQLKLSSAGQALSASTARIDEFVMVPKIYFNERLAEIKELEERMQNLNIENEYTLEQKDQEIQERLQTMQLERRRERLGAEEKYDAMFVNLTKAHERHEKEMVEANQAFDHRAKNMNDGYEDRLAKEIDKQSRLLCELQTLRETHEADKRAIDQRNEEQVADLRKTQEQSLREWRNEFDKVCNLLKTDGLKFEEALRQQESEYEQQITEMLEQKRQALQAESEKSTTALKDGVSMKQTINLLQKEMQAKNEELKDKKQESADLTGQLQRSGDMCRKVQEQLSESKQGLKVKDQTLAKLREQQKHLESFRFVLFHKVRSLEQERDPLEEQVNSRGRALREMYDEFKREFLQNRKLLHDLDDKKQRADSLQIENVELRASLTQVRKDAKRLLQDVEEVLHEVPNDKKPKKLQEILDRNNKLGLIEGRKERDPFQNKRDSADEGGTADGDEEAAAVQPFMMMGTPQQHMREMERQAKKVEEITIQRDLLLRKNNIANEASRQLGRERASDFRRLTSENSQLISELNKLRTEKRSYLRRVTELEARLPTENSESLAPGSQMSRNASAPSLGGQQDSLASAGGSAGASGRPPRGGEPPRSGRAAADTPYVRRKVVANEEVKQRQRQKLLNQLPPAPGTEGAASASYAPGSAGSSTQDIQPSVQERQFTGAMSRLQAGRRTMENQGFDMSRLSDAAEAASGFEAPPQAQKARPGRSRTGLNSPSGSGSATELPLERPPSNQSQSENFPSGEPPEETDDGSFPPGDPIQSL